MNKLPIRDLKLHIHEVMNYLSMIQTSWKHKSPTTVSYNTMESYKIVCMHQNTQNRWRWRSLTKRRYRLDQIDSDIDNNDHIRVISSFGEDNEPKRIDWIFESREEGNESMFICLPVSFHKKELEEMEGPTEHRNIPHTALQHILNMTYPPFAKSQIPYIHPIHLCAVVTHQ